MQRESARATMSVAPGAMTVVATHIASRTVAVYRGSPAGPDPQGAAELWSPPAPPRIISATATIDVPVPPTTTTTTTLPPETTTTDHDDRRHRPRPPTTTMPPTTTIDHRRRCRQQQRLDVDDVATEATPTAPPPDHDDEPGPPETTTTVAPLPGYDDDRSLHPRRRGVATRAATAEDRQGLRLDLLPRHLAVGGRDRDRRRRQRRPARTRRPPLTVVRRSDVTTTHGQRREGSSTLDEMTPVEALERVVHCLDRAHETGFKTKAFVRALEVVRATPIEELEARAEAGTLTDLEGIGDSTARLITEALRGDTSYVDKIEAETQVKVTDEGARYLAALKGDCHLHSRGATGERRSRRWLAPHAVSATTTWC